MNLTDSRIDAYIARSAEFAVPILQRLRDIVHSACPMAEETMKWSFPHFMYKGQILCSMAAFKQHCTFGFWPREGFEDIHGVFKTSGAEKGMGHFGRIQSVQDLPDVGILHSYIHLSMELIDSGKKLPRSPVKKEPPPLPEDLSLKLNQEAGLAQKFQKMSHSHQHEYVNWINEAKRPETREKRILKALQMVKQGSGLNDKYSGK